MASDGVYSVTLDEAIEAMRLTAADMSVSTFFFVLVVLLLIQHPARQHKYKETALSVSLVFLRGWLLFCADLTRFTRDWLWVASDSSSSFSADTNLNRPLSRFPLLSRRAENQLELYILYLLS
jgi:hypothetical protein